MRPLRARKPLAEEAADQIREEILAGRLGQGERLVEVRIADALNIGTYVVQLSSDDVREIYDLRAAIESRAAKLLARSGRPADLEAIRQALSELEDAADRRDIAAVSRTDLAFHETVCRLTGNRRLHEVFMRHVPVVRTMIRLDEHLYASPEEIAGEHRPMVEAIEARDPELAAARFETHVELAFGRVSEYIEHLPGVRSGDGAA
jgi:DNA-binding GntR family transcriptional regulator